MVIHVSNQLHLPCSCIPFEIHTQTNRHTQTLAHTNTGYKSAINRHDGSTITRPSLEFGNSTKCGSGWRKLSDYMIFSGRQRHRNPSRKRRRKYAAWHLRWSGLSLMIMRASSSGLNGRAICKFSRAASCAQHGFHLSIISWGSSPSQLWLICQFSCRKIPAKSLAGAMGPCMTQWIIDFWEFPKNFSSGWPDLPQSSSDVEFEKISASKNLNFHCILSVVIRRQIIQFQVQLRHYALALALARARLDEECRSVNLNSARAKISAILGERNQYGAIYISTSLFSRQDIDIVPQWWHDHVIKISESISCVS